eukprot:6941175-Prymnesium_polylepis.1
MVFWEDDTSSRTPYLHQVMKWYRSRTVNCKLHHRATTYITCRKRRRKLRRQTSQLKPCVGSERGRRVGS